MVENCLMLNNYVLRHHSEMYEYCRKLNLAVYTKKLEQRKLPTIP